MSENDSAKKFTFELTKKKTILLASVLIVLAWTLYLARVLINIDLLNWGDQKKPTDPFVLFYIAIAGTVIATLWCIITVRKLDVLTKRGVVGEATVTSVSILRKFGESPVTLSYTVNGKEYTARRDLPRSDFKTGDTVKIIYDPLNPSTWKLA